MDYPQIAVYVIIGACFFSILGFISAKSRGDDTGFKSTLRDAISGAFLTVFLTYLIPDYFPVINLQTLIPSPRMIDSDMDLQFRMPPK